MSARAGFGALPALEMKRLALLHLVHAPAETCGSELVEVAGVARLLIGQHAAFSGADSSASHLGTLGKRDLGLAAQGSKAHVTDEERYIEMQWPFCVRADDDVGPDRHIAEQWLPGELSGQEQYVVPKRKLLPRHPHGREGTVVAHLLQTVASKLLDVPVERLLGGPVHVRVETQIRVSIVGLRRLLRPSPNLFFIDQHCVRIEIDPRSELRQHLDVVVGADARVVSIVPAM